VLGGFRISIIFFVHNYFKNLPTICIPPLDASATVVTKKAKQGCG